MMFQGSQNLGKMAFIRLVQSNGGVLDGSTRQRVTALTPRGIQSMARKYLCESAMTVVIVGDREAILDQVRSFGMVRLKEKS